MAFSAEIQGALMPQDNTEFLKRFCEEWGMTRAELSQLTGKSTGVIDHWFSPKSGREIPTDVAAYLRMVHITWLRWEREDAQREDEDENLGAQIKPLYNLLTVRKRLKDK